MVIASWLVTLVVMGGHWQYVKQQASATYAWVAAPGVVEQSSWTPAGGQIGGFRAMVRYSYEVDGERYERWGVWFDLSTTSEARQVTERYLAGQSHEVYYAPSDPSRSVLQRGTYPQGPRYALENGLTWGLPMPALLLTLVVFSERKKRRVSQPGETDIITYGG